MVARGGCKEEGKVEWGKTPGNSQHLQGKREVDGRAGICEQLVDGIVGIAGDG